MEVATLETIYSADLSNLEQGAAKAQGVFDETAKSAERSSDRVTSSFKRTAQTASKSIDDAFKEADARLSKKFREVERSVESLEKQASSIRPKAAIRSDLLSELPAGSSINRVRNISDELKKLSQIAGETEGGVSKVSAVIGALGGPLIVGTAGVLALGAGVAALGVGLFKLANYAAETGDKLDTLSKQTNFSVTTLSALNNEAGPAGTTIERLASGLNTFNKNLETGDEKGKRMVAILRALKINTSDNETALRGAFQALSKLPEGYQQSALAQRLFGTAGDEVLGIIKESHGDLDKLIQKHRDLGTLVSGEAAAAAVKYKNQLHTVELQIGAITQSLGEALLPVATQTLSEISDSLKENKDQWRQWGSDIASGTSQAIQGIKDLNNELRQVSDWLDKQAGFHPFSNIGGDALDRAAGLMPSGPRTPRPTKFDYTDPASRASAQGSTGDPTQRTGIDPSLLATGRTGARSSGESAARRAARQALELAQIDLRDAESIYNQKLSIERRAYDQSLKSHEQYTAQIIDAENKRYEAEVAAFQREREGARQLPTPGEQNVKLQDIQQREREAERKHQETVANNQTEGNQKKLDDARRYAEQNIQIHAKENSALELLQREFVEQGTKTSVDAENFRYERERQIFAERQKLANEDLARVKDTNDARYKAAEQALKDLAVDEEAAQQEHNRKIKAALGDDLNTRQSYAQKIRDIGNEIRDNSIETSQLNLEPLSNNNLRRSEFIRKTAELEVDIEKDRARRINDSRKEELERLNLYIDNQIGDVEQYRAQKKQLLGLMVSDEELSTQRIIDIERQAAEKRREYLVEVADDLAGIFNDIRSGLGDGWENFWDNLLNTVKRTVDSILDELTRVTFESLITGENRGSNAGGLVGSVVNAITRPLFGNTPAPTPGALTTTTANANFGPVPNRPLIQGSRASGGPVNEGLWQLHNREYVIDADSTAALGGDFLARLNRANSRADASMMLAGLGQSFNRQPTQAPAQGDINVIMALGEREIGKATETYGRTASGRRAAVMRARFDSKSVRRF